MKANNQLVLLLWLARITRGIQVRKMTMLVMTGAIACFLFLAACGANRELFAVDQDSSSSSCKAWEVALGSISVSVDIKAPTPLEVGWEPFSSIGSAVMLRRCAGNT